MFLQDVLVAAVNDSMHLKCLHHVLTRIKDQGLRLAAKKYKYMFMQFTVDYLGHTVSGSGISTMSKKVQAVQNAPVHKKVSELRSFLGTCKILRTFCAQVIYDTETSDASTV